MNMPYCKYQNTLAALKQIASSEDEELSREEQKAKEQLCSLMMDLVCSINFNPYFDSAYCDDSDIY